MVNIGISDKKKRLLQLNCDVDVLNRIRCHFSVANPAFRRNNRHIKILDLVIHIFMSFF